MAAPVKIQGFETHPTRELRVLGIWLDPKLSWGPQVKKAQARADTNRQSIERLTASTWGATFTKAQTMYKAIVKPAMLYGAAIWAAEKHIPKRIEDPLNRAQAACLKRVLGAYKSTPHRTMEMESGTAPIREYLQGMRCQYAEKTSAYPAQGTIQAATQRIRTQWERRRRPNRPHMIPQKEADLKTSQEILAALEQREALREQANTGDKGKKKQSQAERIAGHLWETRWNQKPVRPGAPPAARTFGRYNYLIYKDLKRAEASIAIQIRSEHIGLRAYLHQRRVPGYDSKRCPCGYLSQNPEHMVLNCTKWVKGRSQWRAKARDRQYQAIIQDRQDIRRVTRWILNEDYLEQFSLAVETERWIERRERERRAGETEGRKGIERRTSPGLRAR